MRYFILITLALLTFASCTREGMTVSNSILMNETSVDIKIDGYKGNKRMSDFSYRIDSKEEIKIRSSWTRGLGDGISYGGDVRTYLDSIVVIFDGRYAITHFRTDTLPEYRGYPVGSERNIYTRSNYKRKQLSKKKRANNWLFTYAFTEEDYLDAKERGREVTP